jgi:nucleotide-binding universal stress UspA family protein
MQYRVLVPYDFSPQAERALVWVAELARLGLVAELHLLQMVNPLGPWPASMVPLPVVSAEEVARMRAQLEAKLVAHGLTGQAEVLLQGEFGAAIVQRARELGVTLIAMGTHGRGMLARAALGSVADHVVRHADCPVLTLRAPE